LAKGAGTTRKADYLPIFNVDPQMRQCGHYVAQQLRNASLAIQSYGINPRVAAVKADNSAAPYGGVVGRSSSD
jgi:hypothetical protein